MNCWFDSLNDQWWHKEGCNFRDCKKPDRDGTPPRYRLLVVILLSFFLGFQAGRLLGLIIQAWR